MPDKSGEHAVFAANLRRLCESETSIADICRDTGINRQQFNKYLAGRAIPSARILRKICQRLGVSETDLLSLDARGTGASLASAGRAHQFGRELDRLFGAYLPENRALTRVTDCDFKAGTYHTYFPFHDVAGYLLRGYLEVWWHKDTMMFSRLTRVNMPGGRQLTLRSRHYGVVLAAKGELSLLGRSRMTPYQVTLMNIQPSEFLKRFFVGLTVTHAVGPPIACRVVLERTPTQGSRRSNLRSCGVVAMDDPSVPDFVRSALHQNHPRGPTLQLPDFDAMIGASILAMR